MAKATETVHHRPKSKAPRRGVSLPERIKKEMQRVAANPPSTREWLEGTRDLPAIRGHKSSAEIIRELRDER
jgi:hypothetical protein